ncbi:hypothetical protein ACTPOK_03280 [Streptomyces inhibens]|uniref:hypothetical protein n=1 Tax=Streptomyces inhibens TaxID=2293571 RepID=UPI00402A9969
MSRSFDDDAASRMNGADEQLSADQRQAAAGERANLGDIRRTIKKWERDLARRRRVTRVRRAALAVAAGALLTSLVRTALAWGPSSRSLGQTSPAAH